MLYLLLSILSLSFLDITRKITVRECSPALMTCFMCATLAIAFFVIATFSGEFSVPGKTTLSYGIASGISGLFGNLLLMRALKTVPLSVAVPLLSFSSVWVVLFEAIGFGINPSTNHEIGILLIIGGSLYLLQPNGGVKKSAELFLPILSSMCWGMQTFIDPIGISGIGILSWGFLICIVGAIFSLPFCFREVTHLKQHWRGLSLLGLLSGIGVFFQLTALLTLSPGIVETMKRGILLPLSLIFGKLIFKEAMSMRKIISIILLIVGTVLASQ